MALEDRFKKIGTEKQKDFDKNFDEMYDKYQKKAQEIGYTGGLVFMREKGKVLIYIVI